jgi:hypothetical protein
MIVDIGGSISEKERAAMSGALLNLSFEIRDFEAPPEAQKDADYRRNEF